MMSVPRILRTARHLEPGQLGWRAVHELKLLAYRRLPRAAQAAWSLGARGGARAADVRVAAPNPLLLARERVVAERWARGRVEYLGVQGDRYDWIAAGRSRLWRYERHYHSELVPLAALAAAEPDRAWAAEARSLVESWIARNPISWGDGWEPYPVARRVLSWSLALALLPRLGDLLAPELAAHLRYLRAHLERHLLGNHLLCDAAALMAGGAMLEGREAERVARQGEALLAGSLATQVLGDGGYAERTLQYHAIVLRDVLVAIALTRARGRDVAEPLRDTARRMASWLRQVRRDDVPGPFMNDAAPDACPPLDEVLSLAAALSLGEAPRLSWLGAIFGGHPLAPPPPTARDVALADTGWTFVREGAHELLFDHGPIGPDEQPGHGHSDALSYELVWEGAPIVTDSGVTTYDVGPVRDFERSARAHATVSVGGEGPDELWSAFRVGGRARVSGGLEATTPEGVRVLSGVVRAWQGWVHARRVVYWPGEALVVLDRVSGARGAVVSHVPLDPACRLEGEVLHAPCGPLRLLVLEGAAGPVVAGETRPRDGWVGEGFGRARARPTLSLLADGEGRVSYAIAAPGCEVQLRAGALALRGPRGEAHVPITD